MIKTNSPLQHLIRTFPDFPLADPQKKPQTNNKRLFLVPLLTPKLSGVKGRYRIMNPGGTENKCGEQEQRVVKPGRSKWREKVEICS